MKGHGTKLGRKQEAAIAALLTAGTLAAAAQSSGVSEATLWRWQQQPDFAALYKQAKTALLEAVTAKLRKQAGSAVDTLAELAGNTDNPAGARVSASRTIVELALRAHELEDLTERLTALEEATERKK
jgi:hypothetical protein